MVVLKDLRILILNSTLSHGIISNLQILKNCSSLLQSITKTGITR